MSDIIERLQAAIHDPETGEPLDTEGQGGMSNASIADVEDAIDAIVTLRAQLAEEKKLIAGLISASSKLNDMHRAQLAAAVPPGHVVVPRVATEAMCRAGSHIFGEYAAQVWTAMVEAGSKRDE